MKPRTTFRIIIATVGLILFFYGVLYLFDGISFALGLAKPVELTQQWYAVRGVFEIVLGLFVMRGIPPLVDWAFPEEPEQKPDAKESDEESTHDA